MSHCQSLSSAKNVILPTSANGDMCMKVAEGCMDSNEVNLYKESDNTNWSFFNFLGGPPIIFVNS